MPNEPKRRARPILLDRATWLAAQRATWQVATIAKRMVEHPDSTASAALSAGMAGGVQDLIADTAKSSGPAAIRNPLHEPRTPKRSVRRPHIHNCSRTGSIAQRRSAPLAPAATYRGARRTTARAPAAEPTLVGVAAALREIRQKRREVVRDHRFCVGVGGRRRVEGRLRERDLRPDDVHARVTDGPSSKSHVRHESVAAWLRCLVFCALTRDSPGVSNGTASRSFTCPPDGPGRPFRIPG